MSDILMAFADKIKKYDSAELSDEQYIKLADMLMTEAGAETELSDLTMSKM